MDPSQLNNNYQRNMANKNEHEHNRNEENHTSSFLTPMPQWSSPTIGNLMKSIIIANANNSALLNRSLNFQNNSNLIKNLALQKNNISHTDSTFQNNLVSQNIYFPQNNFGAQNNLASQDNLRSQRCMALQKNITSHTDSGFNNNLVFQYNLAPQNYLALQKTISSNTDLDLKKKLINLNIRASQNKLDSQGNIPNRNNFISLNNKAFKNNSDSRNIWSVQNNSVSQTNFTSQNNLTSQINLDSQTSSINSDDVKDLVTQRPLLPQYNLSNDIVLNNCAPNYPLSTLTNCPPINSNIRQGENSNNQLIDHENAMRPLQRMGRLYTGPNHEFKMCPNDFPQLPGIENANNCILSTTTTNDNQQLKMDAVKKVNKSKNKNEMGASIDVRDLAGKTNDTQQTIIQSNSNIDTHKNIEAVIKTEFETSVQTLTKNSTSKNICDQFGLGGLVSTLRSASSNPGLVELALGEDLTEIVVDLNSPKDLFPTFDGPFAKFPIAPHNELISETPPEYITSTVVKHTIASLDMSKYGVDTLFYLFYTFYGEEIQLLAAKQLRERGWRFHTVLFVWISLIEGTFKDITEGYEQGSFNVFDQGVWKIIPQEMLIDYSKLEGHGVKLTE